MAHFVLCAGGTGGHLFPAQALSEVLIARGHTVDLITDERAERYGVTFPARAVHIVSSATFSPRRILQAAPAIWKIAKGATRAFFLLGRERPAAIIGFGGYPTLPPLMAAWLRRIPIVLHEQNAVLGRANMALAKRATLIATSFAQTDGIPADTRAIILQTGNPVRQSVIDLAKTPYPALRGEGEVRLVAFGGSQGARVFADLVPGALEQFDPATRKRFRVTQQCRPEDLARVRDAYEALGVPCDLAAFFVDMPERMARAHLIVARAGASTVAELSALGRPSILVPYPHSLDHDQAKNAERLEAEGGAVVVPQKSIGPVRLSQLLARFIDAESRELVTMARAAQAAGRPDAVHLLATEVEAFAAKDAPKPGPARSAT